MDFEKAEYQRWLAHIENDEMYKELMNIVSESLVLFEEKVISLPFSPNFLQVNNFLFLFLGF